MSENNDHKGVLSPADEISVKKIVVKMGDYRRYIVSRWKILALIVLIGGAAGLLASIYTKPVYTAECTFVLEEDDKGGSGLGQYSALASIAGIDVGGTSGLFQSDNIIQLYKSRLMVEKTLLSHALFRGKDALLIDKYIEMNKLREAWGNSSRLSKIDFDIPKEKFTVDHDSLMNRFVADINKNYLSIDKPDKKLSLISIKVKARDQLFAKVFAEVMVQNVNGFYIQTKTKKAQQNVSLLQRQADSVHRIVNISIGRAAYAADATPNPDPSMLQTLRAPSQRRQVDVQAATTIYGEVVRNLEISRAALQRATPLIQVIDEPVMPLPVDRLGKIKGVLTGAIIGLILAILWLISAKTYREMMA